MATSNQFCTLCLEEGVSCDAISWCSECETFLCTDCATHHGRSKASKMHDVVTVDEVKKLPAFVMETGNKCDAHERMNDFYCQLHQIACCVYCIKSDHKDCRELVPLSDILSDIKSSVAVSRFETDVKKLITHYVMAMEAIPTKLENVEKQKVKCIDKIGQMREKINHHLDKIQMKLEDDLSLECSQIIRQMNSLQNELEAKMKNILQVGEDFGRIKSYGSNVQAFSALKSYETFTKEEYTFLSKIQDEGSLCTIDLDVDASSICKMFDLNSFGELLLTEVEKLFYFKMEPSVQVPKEAVNIENEHPKFITKLEDNSILKGGRIRNCLVCPNGEKVLVDQGNKRLVRFSNDNKFIGYKSLRCRPCGICYFGNNSVAISFNNDKMILVVDLGSKKTIQDIKVPYQCYGIDVNDQYFYVSFADIGMIGRLDLNGKNLSLVCKLDSKNYKEITVCENRIYCSNYRSNTVSCYQTSGTLIWKNNHRDIRKPHGLSIDRNGNAYVACHDNNSIVAISPDGKNCKVILDDKNGIIEPKALHVNKELALLLVHNKKGCAMLFQL